MRENVIVVITGFFIGIGLIVLIAALSAIPVMLLWDWLMPTLFGLKTITLFQAWGLNVLCGILFKSKSSNKTKVDKESNKQIIY